MKISAGPWKSYIKGLLGLWKFWCTKYNRKCQIYLCINAQSMHPHVDQEIARLRYLHVFCVFSPSIAFFLNSPKSSKIIFFHSQFCKIHKIIRKKCLYNPESLIYLHLFRLYTAVHTVIYELLSSSCVAVGIALDLWKSLITASCMIDRNDRSQVRWEKPTWRCPMMIKILKTRDFHRQFTHFLLYFFHKPLTFGREIIQTPIVYYC